MIERLYQVLTGASSPDEAIEKLNDFIAKHYADWQERAKLIDAMKVLLVLEHFKARYRENKET